MTKQYNSDLENGIKSSLFKLQDLHFENKIVDSDISMAITLLQKLVIKAQNGEIEHTREEEED